MLAQVCTPFLKVVATEDDDLVVGVFFLSHLVMGRSLLAISCTLFNRCFGLAALRLFNKMMDVCIVGCRGREV